MDFSIQKDDSYTYIRVLNEKLDYLMAPGLKSELVLIVANGEMNILVDLSGCNFCDSSGLSALLLGNRLCKDANGMFILYGCTSGSLIKGLGWDREIIKMIDDAVGIPSTTTSTAVIRASRCASSGMRSRSLAEAKLPRR